MKKREIKTKQNYMARMQQAGQSNAPLYSAQRGLRMAARQSREIAERGQQPEENSTQYAESRIGESAERIGSEAARHGKHMAHSVRGRTQNRADSTDHALEGGQAARQDYRQQTMRRQRADHAQRTAQETETAGRPVQQAAQSTGTARRTAQTSEKAIKAGNKGIKTAEKGIKTGAKATQATARTAQAAAQTTARASARIVQATKAAAKAVVSAVKAIASGVKSLVTAIAAGGWVAVVILLAVAVIVLVLGSAFGLFFTNDLNDGRLKQAMIDTNTQFTADLQAEIDRLSSGGYDAVVVSYDGDYDGDSAMVNNWQDVLAVFAVKNMYEGEELLDFDDEKAAALGLVFRHMNRVEIDTHVETTSSTSIVDGEEVTETTTTLYINIAIESLTYLEGADLYRFDEEERRMLEELMQGAYNALWAGLLDVDLYGGLSFEELTEISANLPAGTKGGIITQTALEKVGTPYSVMDCSQLSRYAYAQASVSLPRTSVEQARYCYNNGYAISRAQLQPGDLIFWSKNCSCGRWWEVHHVGVYLGNGKIVDASSSKGRVVLRDLWGENGSTWRIVLYARPHI